MVWPTRMPDDPQRRYTVVVSIVATRTMVIYPVSTQVNSPPHRLPDRVNPAMQAKRLYIDATVWQGFRSMAPSTGIV